MYSIKWLFIFITSWGLYIGSFFIHPAIGIIITIGLFAKAHINIKSSQADSLKADINSLFID